MSNAQTIRQFLGTSADWPSYFIAVVDAAKRSSSVETHGFGLIPYLFIDPEDVFLVALPGFDVPHVPQQPPGPKPALPDNPTAAQLNLYTAQFNAWKYDAEHFSQLRTDISNFLSVYLGSLPEVTLTSIRDPLHGTSLLSLATTTTSIRNLYGTLSPADLTANEALLNKPYVIRRRSANTQPPTSPPMPLLNAMASHSRSTRKFDFLRKASLLLVYIITSFSYGYLPIHAWTSKHLQNSAQFFTDGPTL